MATYAIGDLQGCYNTLQKLLEKIHFSETSDYLWFTGDLVNRGQGSLECLRFVKNLGDRAITVLGNHDLHLLALHFLEKPALAHDTLAPILAASDSNQLCEWLRKQPLLHHCPKLNYTLTHAGIYPLWDLTTAQRLALEAHLALQNNNIVAFFHHMYGNEPASWQDDLSGYDRLRFIINAFTRMRTVNTKAELNLNFKGTVEQIPVGYMPWFKFPHRQNTALRILFGHWAALDCKTLGEPNIFPLDSGCVWGKSLTALRLEDQVILSQPFEENG